MNSKAYFPLNIKVVKRTCSKNLKFFMYLICFQTAAQSMITSVYPHRKSAIFRTEGISQWKLQRNNKDVRVFSYSIGICHHDYQEWVQVAPSINKRNELMICGHSCLKEDFHLLLAFKGIPPVIIVIIIKICLNISSIHSVTQQIFEFFSPVLGIRNK